MCIDYAASFVKAGEEDPIERQMQDLLKLEFSAKMPDNTESFEQKQRIAIQGKTLVREVTRICKLKDGTEQTIKSHDTRELIIWQKYFSLTTLNFKH